VSRQEQRPLSYLLRMWPIRTRGALVWRASLESARTGDRRGFASLADLFAYLEDEVAHVADQDRHRPQSHNKERRNDCGQQDSTG
jgi:hypothetical protein